MNLYKKLIGKYYGPVKYEVCAEKIKEYAMAINDLNPIYFKEEEAVKAGFRTIVAPPLFAAVYIWKLVNLVINDPEVGLDLPMLVHAEQEFEFEDSVYAGDVILTEGKIKDMHEKKNLQFVLLDIVSMRDSNIITKGISTFTVRRR